MPQSINTSERAPATRANDATERRDERLRVFAEERVAIGDAQSEAMTGESTDRSATSIVAKALNASATAGPWALCLSGGGIRSAATCLGVLQGLARGGYLSRFDYLSTVSGGGYIGSWLTGWVRRSPGGIAGIEKQLIEANADEPAEVQHLRRYASYLNPSSSPMSPDTWTLISTYSRNLLLNWVILLPLAAGLVLLVHAVGAMFCVVDGSRAPGVNASNAILCAMLIAACLIGLAFGSIGLDIPSVRRSEAGRARQKQPRAFLTRSLMWLACAAVLVPLVTPLNVALPGSWIARLATSLVGGAEGPSQLVAEVMLLVASSLCAGVSAWFLYAARRPTVGYGRAASMLRSAPSLFAALAASAVLGVALFGARKLFGVWADGRWGGVLALAAFGPPMMMIIVALGAAILTGALSRIQSSSDEDREWFSRAMAWMLLAGVAWAMLFGVVLLLPLLWLRLPGLLTAGVGLAGGGSGLIAIVLGMSSWTRPMARKGESQSLIARIVDQIPAITAPLAIAGFVSGLSLALAALVGLSVVPGGWEWNEAAFVGLHTYGFSVLMFVVAGAVCTLASIVVSGAVHSNKFTLHAMYRDRLIRAFLGASNRKRSEDAFTGFDPGDNIWLHELHPVSLRREDWDGDAQKIGDFVLELAAQLNASTAPIVAALRRELGAIDEFDWALARATRGVKSEKSAVDMVLRSLNFVMLHRDVAGLGRIDPVQNRRRLEDAFGGHVPRMPAAGVRLRPLHVVNLTLNAAQMKDTARQQRQAYLFTATPLRCGCDALGYRESVLYGGHVPRRFTQAIRYLLGVGFGKSIMLGVPPSGISLGTVMAISGAAASPSMGYHSSVPVAFLLTLFNVRLGAWLGNPGPAGDATYREASPALGILPTVNELLGRTSETWKYVYLSDGGHFENLGVYAMLQRRCPVIVSVDAGCDPHFAHEDLGRALSQARVDLGVTIKFTSQSPIGLPPAESAQDATRPAIYVAEIGYPADGDVAAATGTLIYIKSRLLGGEPAHVRSYAAKHPEFPHESTGNQFFTEQQFEAYRAFGEHLVLS